MRLLKRFNCLERLGSCFIYYRIGGQVMTNFERINRQTDRLKKMLAILEKAKTKMGDDKFNKVMDELSYKSLEK